MKMRWMSPLAIVVLIVYGLAHWPAAYAAEDEEGAPIAVPQRVFTDHGVTYVKLDRESQQAIGLQTQTLKSTAYRARLQAYGQVLELGTLLDDYQQLAGAKATAARARAQFAASHAEYRRLSGLYQNSRNVSKKEVQTARAAWLSDQAAAEGAKARLSVVTHKIEARWGLAIAPWIIEDKPMFAKLAEDKARLLKLTLPPGRAPTDPPPTAQLLLADGITTAVSLVSRAPQVEPDLQGQGYYFLATKQLNELSYGLRVTALMPYGPARRGVVVPEAAVVWSQGSAWTYIKAGNARFERKPVRTETPVPGGWFQASGLGPGSQVVSRGVSVLLSVQALASAPKTTGGEGD